MEVIKKLPSQSLRTGTWEDPLNFLSLISNENPLISLVNGRPYVSVVDLQLSFVE